MRSPELISLDSMVAGTVSLIVKMFVALRVQGRLDSVRLIRRGRIKI